jgi:TRAP-type C4-dicarboxylate transport system substrate-binding protein
LIGNNEPITELKNGVADVAWVAGDYQASGFEIEKAMRVFLHGMPNKEFEHHVYDEICAKFPEILEEWSEVKIMRYGGPPFFNLASTKPVRKLADFQGMMIKAAGAEVSAFSKFGADGIAMPRADVYMGLEKGTIDGAIIAWEGLASMKIAEVSQYGTYLNITPGSTPHRAMNLDAYNSLPPDIQKIFDDSVAVWTNADDTLGYEMDDLGINLANDMGFEFFELSPEEMDEFNAAWDEVAREEAAKLDAKGYPATAIYEEIQTMLKNYK